MKNSLVISKISYLKVNSWMEIKKSDKVRKNAYENFGTTLREQYLTVGVQWGAYIKGEETLHKKF